MIALKILIGLVVCKAATGISHCILHIMQWCAIHMHTTFIHMHTTFRVRNFSPFNPKRRVYVAVLVVISTSTFHGSRRTIGRQKHLGPLAQLDAFLHQGPLNQVPYIRDLSTILHHKAGSRTFMWFLMCTNLNMWLIKE